MTPHSISTESKTDTLKRYLSESKYRIKLWELVIEEGQSVREKTSNSTFSANQDIPWDTKTVTERVRRYEDTCSNLLPAAMIGGFWAEDYHYQVWRQTLKLLGGTQSKNGVDFKWLDLQVYPATLLFYALGISAVTAERLHFLEHMFSTRIFNYHKPYDKEPRKAVQILPPYTKFSLLGPKMKILEGMSKNICPLNNWIYDVLSSYAHHITVDKDQYTLAFDKLEILVSLNSLTYENELRTPGLYYLRHDNRSIIIREIRESLSTLGDKSPFVTCSVFGRTVDGCRRRLDDLESWVNNFSGKRDANLRG